MMTAQKIAAPNRLPIADNAKELKKLILKLRWIGLENEASALHRRLADLAPGECAGLWPRDTD